MMNLLEIGDKVYKLENGETSYFGQIDRVTEKMACIKDTRFKRKYVEMSYIDLYSNPKKSNIRFHIETPVLKKKAVQNNRQFLKEEINGVLNKLDNDGLEFVAFLFSEIKTAFLEEQRKIKNDS